MAFQSAYQAACNTEGIAPREELFDDEGELTSLVVNGNCAERFTNRVVDKDVAAFCKALSATPTVTYLDLSYNKITDAGASMLADVFRRNTSIRTVDLSQNDIGPDGACALADALMMNMSITALSLRGNAIGERGGMAFGTMLRGNNTLGSLDLANCELSTKALVSLTLSLATHPEMAAFSLDKPLLRGPQDLLTVMQHLSMCLSKNNVLQSLSLNYFGLTDEHLITLLPPLVQNESIKYLSFVGNRFSVEGAQCLGKLLSRRPDLVSLDADGNRFNDDGAIALATVLRSHPSIQRLSLTNCGIHDRGLIALAEAIHNGAPALVEIRLWGNRFEGGSSAAFHKMQSRLNSLDVDFETYEVDGVALTSQK